MGASNALAAYALYASKVPATPLSALVYMTLVSKDADPEPWWSEGFEVLAIQALGRDPLSPTDDEKEDAKAKRAMERAVERAIAPLFGIGAITVKRHSSGHPGNPHYVKYRLWLVWPAPDEMREPRHRGGDALNSLAPHGKRRVQNSAESALQQNQHDSAPHGNRGALTARTPRKVSPHPTESVAAPDENRGAKEYEEYEERDKPEEHMVLSSDSVPVPAREEADADFENGPSRQGQRDQEAPSLAPVDSIRCEYEHCPVPQKPVPAGSRHHTGCGLAMRRAPDASPKAAAFLATFASSPEGPDGGCAA